MEFAASDRLFNRRALLASIMSGPVLIVAPSSRGDTVKVINQKNLMPAFFAVYERAGPSLAEMERVEILGKNFFLPNAETYTQAGFNGGNHGRLLDSIVADWLRRFDALAPVTKSLAEIAPRVWALEQARFRKYFPDFRPAGQVVFMVSLFAFNAMTTGLRHNEIVFFGLDTVAQRTGTSAGLAVAMAHELGHLYQSQISAGALRPELWSRLWSEGLATFVSGKLHPRAGPAGTYMSHALAVATRAQIADGARKAIANLDETKGPISHELLDATDDASHLDRLGYLLGEHVVSHALVGKSLQALFAATSVEARGYVADALTRLSEN